MELSLFAEAFAEMLSRDYGETILAALYKERCARPTDTALSSGCAGRPFSRSALPSPTHSAPERTQRLTCSRHLPRTCRKET